MAKAVKKNQRPQSKQINRFSNFFRNASPEEKEKVIKQVIRESNAVQRKLMEEAVDITT